MRELTVKARIENTSAVLDFVSEQTQGCPPKTRNQMMLASDEIFSNIARYAYHPLTGDAVVRVCVLGDTITIEFEDRGAAFNPLSADAPDVSSPAGEREIGGLGIWLVRNIMDSVEYRREDGRNILTVTKAVRGE